MQKDSAKDIIMNRHTEQGKDRDQRRVARGRSPHSQQEQRQEPRRENRRDSRPAARALAPAARGLAIAGLFGAGAALAQPYKGDLTQYETRTTTAGSSQRNLLFIADTSGSMDNYLAEEQDSGCSAQAGRASTIQLTGERINKNSWDRVDFNNDPRPSRVLNGSRSDNRLNKVEFFPGSQLTLNVRNTDSKDGMRGGLRAYELTAQGLRTIPEKWSLVCNNTYAASSSGTCTVSVDTIPYANYEVQVWLRSTGTGTSRLGSDSTLTYTPPASSPECAVSAVASNAVDIRPGITPNIYLRKRGESGTRSSHWLKASDSDTRIASLASANNKANTRTPANFCQYFHEYDRFFLGTNPHRRANRSKWRPAGNISHPVVAPNEIYLKHDDPGKVYVCRHKGKTMTDATADLVRNAGGANLGLMRYNRRHYTNNNINSADAGATLIYAVQDIDTEAKRNELLKLNDTVNGSLGLRGATPLAETLSEAYRYFKGDTAKYSRLSKCNVKCGSGDYPYKPDDRAFTSPGVYERNTLRSRGRSRSQGGTVKTPGVYKSPITDSCQINDIVFLTDGAPERDSGGGLVSSCQAKAGDKYRGSNCIDDIAEKLATEDLSATVDEVNTVRTFTVGFDIDLPLLETTARKGKGRYFTANDSAGLRDAFREIISDIKATSQIVAPNVSVNRFNRLQHRTDFYYATFKPSVDAAWEGNLKRYKLKDGKVVDGAGNDAVDNQTGLFKDTARSFWLDPADDPDGAEVTEGGYRAKLTNTRGLYLPAALFEGSKTGITQVAKTDKLKPAAFGLADAAAAETLRNWLLGIDVDDYNDNDDTSDAHRYVSDSLHSNPFVVTYAGTEAAPRDIAFVATNLGALRAINASTGDELWSYIPTELAKNANSYRINDSSKSHWDIYGLDGKGTLWVTEPTSAGSTRKVDKVRLYQGMRRGGRSVYAWDLSNADKDIGGNSSRAPISELWKITGGSTSGFADLGYTWSAMRRTRLRYNCASAGGCTTKDVLVFSGGYDAYYDTATNAPKTSATGNTLLGRAVYIVDALTGAKLWSAGPAGSADNHDLELPIHNSVPGDPAVLDVDGDGVLDMLYFVDISGAVFRVDFDSSKALSDSDISTGGLVADLRETSVFRRFYNAPDVALFAEGRDPPYLTVSLGSGYRANPTEELKGSDAKAALNRFYVLEDKYPAAPARFGGAGSNKDDITYKYVETRDSEGELTKRDIVKLANLHAYSDDDPYSRNSGKHGFYRQLDAKEKILQPSTTFDGDILVSSYLPVIAGNAGVDQCSGQSGQSRLYKFSANTGKSTFVINRPNEVTPPTVEPYRTLLSGVIPPEPSILLVPDPVVCVGSQCFENLLTLDEIGRAERVYWREAP